MSVYFIKVGRYFKIGYAEDARRRFERLHQSGTRYTFPVDASWSIEDRALYKVVDGDKSDERRIQLALDDFTVGLEWFLDEPAVRDFVDALPTDCYDLRPVKVRRVGGFCSDEYRAVQHGRALRETARFMARRSA